MVSTLIGIVALLVLACACALLARYGPEDFPIRRRED